MSATLLNDFRDTREEPPIEESNPLLDRIAARRTLLTVSTLVAAGAGIAFCAFVPAKYEARSVLLLPVDGAGASTAASLLGANGPNPLDVLRGIATSYPTQSRIERKFGVREREFRDLLKVTGDSDSNELTLSVTDSRKPLAIGILNETIAALGELNRDLGFSAAGRQANYLTETIKEKEAGLTAARKRLADFQRTMQAPSDPSDPASVLSVAHQLRQTQMDLAAADKEAEATKRQIDRAAASSLSQNTVLPASAAWRPRLVEAEYQFRLIAGQYGPQNPEYIAAKRLLDETRAAAQREVAQNVSAIRAGIDPLVAPSAVHREVLRAQVGALQRVADKAPDEALAVTKLIADVRNREAVLQDLQRRYESSKVDAQVDKVRWSVLEKPHLSEEPTNKSFGRQAALFGSLGFLGALVVPSRRKKR